MMSAMLSLPRLPAYHVGFNAYVGTRLAGQNNLKIPEKYPFFNVKASSQNAPLIQRKSII